MGINLALIILNFQIDYVSMGLVRVWPKPELSNGTKDKNYGRRRLA